MPAADPDAPRRVMEATLDVVRDHGIAGVSARSIARAGDFSQALIYYHFDSVESLLVAACRAGTSARVAHWSERMAHVGTFAELVDLAESLHDDEDERGNVTVLTQFLAGAQTHPGLAAATGEALEAWLDEIRPLVGRLLSGVADGLLDPVQLAGLVADAFVGIELAASTRDRAALHERFDALRHMASILDSLSDLGALTAGLVTRRVAKRATQREGANR